ncbi:MAG: tetratricopeptide repeat protein [Bacteroidales bacterium]|jgi:tetratricopeptide (TPR) repeat protein|nr:tetratricopeptide repeat protein [Bacteroidales bacterium]
MSDKKDHREDDQLEQNEHLLSDSEKFIEKNQKLITNVILGVMVVVLAIMAYSRYVVSPKEVEAQSQIFAGEMLFEQDSFRIAIEGDGNFMGFEYIVDNYGATSSGNLAKYYTGISYFKLGEYDLAIKFLNKFSADGEMMPPIKAGAIGDCYVELGDFRKAISSFKKAASYKNNFTAPIYLKKCGIALEANDEQSDAIACYEDIKAQYPTSTEANDIDKYIARAKAAATK